MSTFFDLLAGPRKQEVFLREAPPVPETGWCKPTYFPDLMQAQVIAYDLETKETDFAHGPGWARGEGHIIGVAVAAIGATGEYGKWYFPVRHEVESVDNFDAGQLFGWLKHTLEDTPNIPKVGANLIYDNGWLTTENIYPVGPLYDVQFAEALIDETARTALEVLAHKYVGRGKTTDSCKQWIMATFPQANDRDWRGYLWRCPPRLVGPYAEDDADLPLAILPRQWEIMQREDTLPLFLRECQSIRMLVKMRQPGITIDLDKAAKLRDLVDAEATQLYAKLSHLAGHKIDSVGSPGQLQKLFDAVGIQYPKTAHGRPSFKKEWLAALADRDGYGKIIGDIREREKLRDTFLDAYLLTRAAIDGRGNGRGTIYCSFHPLRGDDGGAKTGRYSCVAAHTPVLTRRGMVAIRDISVDDYVWTHRGRWRRVIERQIKGVEQMFAVRFTTGDVLTCTKAHKMLSDEDEWVSLEECFGRQHQVGLAPVERRTGTLDVSTRGLVSDACTNSRELGDNVSDSVVCCSKQYAGSRAESSRSVALFKQQDSRAQPNVWENRRSASQLDRAVRRRQRLLDLPVQRQTTVCTPLGASSSSGARRVAGKIRQPSYRFGQEEQQHRQPSTLHKSWSQADTLVLRARHQSVGIETIIDVVGSCEVYDITVEEDHSYYACGVFSHNSSDPNLQNIPSRTMLGKKVREAFIPDYGHHSWMKMDHSQIEYRFFAHFATGPRSDEIRWRYNNDPATDYHNDTMLDVASKRGIDLGLMSKDERDRFRKPIKNINFGLLYGQTEKSLAYKAGWSEQESKDFFAAYHAGRPFVRTTMSAIQSEVQYYGYITTIRNRRLRFNLWEPLRYGERTGALGYDAAVRQWGSAIRRAYAYRGVNYKFQGSAADVLKEGMLQCYEQGVYDYIGFPKLQVHDELDWSKISNDRAMNEAYRYAAHVMEQAVKLTIPLKVDSSEGLTWGEAT